MQRLWPIGGACCRVSTAAAHFLDRPSATTNCIKMITNRMSTSTSSTLLNSKQVDCVVAARQQLVRQAPIQVLRMRGVTFENRQAAVQQLALGQPVMFVQEPGHPQDPQAVAISALDGTQLGFVSRDIKSAFQLPVCFGSVSFVSQVPTADGTGNWGAQVSCCPGLWGMSLDLLPHAWTQQTDVQSLQEVAMGKQFGGQRVNWHQYEDLVLSHHHQRCAISGISNDILPLQLAPRWVFDHHNRQAQLHAQAPFIPLCEPLVQLQHMAERGLNEMSLAERHTALELLRWMNRWTEQQCETYLQYVERRRQQMVDEGWTLDVAAPS